MHIIGKAARAYLVVITLFVTQSFLANYYDNQYLPLIEYRPIMPDGLVSSVMINGFAATGSSAVNNREKTIGIPEIYGSFDLGQLATAYSVVYPDRLNPLPSDLRGFKIPYIVGGKLQAQGIDISYYQKICPFLFGGISLLAFRVNGSQDFILNKNELGIITTPGMEQEFDDARRELFNDLGFQNRSHQGGLGDLDLYLRVAYLDEYKFKFRRFDVGLRGGILVPTGKKRILSEPTSIPFGGDGHFGMYAQFDGLFELKEDFKVGVLCRVSKRVAKIQEERLSVEGEPMIYGADTGLVRVDPGVTLVFSPWLVLEGVRAGLGLGIYYTLTVHHEDGWRDVRANRDVPVTLSKTMEATEWGRDLFTAQIFYDFGKTKPNRIWADPILSFRWDIPVSLYVTKNTTKVNRVSLGVEFPF